MKTQITQHHKGLVPNAICPGVISHQNRLEKSPKRANIVFKTGLELIFFLHSEVFLQTHQCFVQAHKLEDKLVRQTLIYTQNKNTL